MKRKFSISGFLVNLLIAGVIAGTGAAHGSAVVAIVAAILFMILAIAKPWLPMVGALLFGGSAFGGEVHLSGINKEIWETHLIENLYPGNEFLMTMSDESEYVNYLTVHSPQAVGTPNVVKNRVLTGTNQGPIAGTNTRADVTLDWGIDEYTTDPFKIVNAEEVQLSYNKRESILYNQEMKIRKVIADNIIVDISPTGGATLPADYGGGTNANILRSSGVTNNDTKDIQSSPAYTLGATGNRLNFTLYDIQAAATSFDALDVPGEDRAMLMSARAWAQVRLDLVATKYRDFTEMVDAATGKPRSFLFGFEIFTRSGVCVYDNTAGTPVVKAVGAATAATDNDAIIFWQKGCVAKAVGDVHVYSDENNPVYYGDIYSGLIRMGAHKARISEVGVGAIVQAASA